VTTLRAVSERPAIVRIDERADDAEARVVITLGYQDEEYAGEATGPPAGEVRPRIVGEATLRAVESVTRGRIHLSLAAVATTGLGSIQVAMAQIEVGETHETMVGSALLGENDQTAATVRAVLDALNRRISTLL
jgi:hypothetical protein